MYDINDNPFNQYNLIMSAQNKDELHRSQTLVIRMIESGYLSLDGLKAATALFQNNGDGEKLAKALEEISKQDHKDTNSIVYLARLKLSLGKPKESFLLICRICY